MSPSSTSNTHSHSCESAGTSGNTSTGIVDSEASAISHHIETLSMQILQDHCNDKDFDTPATDYMAPSFSAQHDGLPTARCREQHLNNLKAHFRAMPDLHLDFLNTSSHVDVKGGTATVYMFLRLTRLINDLERESVAVLQWERRHGEWLCVKHTGMRGPSGFPDE